MTFEQAKSLADNNQDLLGDEQTIDGWRRKAVRIFPAPTDDKQLYEYTVYVIKDGLSYKNAADKCGAIDFDVYAIFMRDSEDLMIPRKASYFWNLTTPRKI